MDDNKFITLCEDVVEIKTELKNRPCIQHSETLKELLKELSIAKQEKSFFKGVYFVISAAVSTIISILVGLLVKIF